MSDRTRRRAARVVIAFGTCSRMSRSPVTRKSQPDRSKPTRTGTSSLSGRRPRAAPTASAGGSSRIVTHRASRAIAPPRSRSDRPRWGRERTSRTSSRTYSLITSSQTPSRAKSRRSLSLPSNTRPLTRVFASTNSLTILLSLHAQGWRFSGRSAGRLAVSPLPRLSSRLVDKLLQAGPGQAALLDLPADGVEQLVFFAKPPDHDGLPQEGDLHVLTPFQPEALPDLLREGELSGGRDLADVRFHDDI